MLWIACKTGLIISTSTEAADLGEGLMEI